jgi:hypothetical protein
MKWFLLALCLAAMTLPGAVWGGVVTNDTEEVSAPDNPPIIEAQPGDALWKPSTEQLARYVNAGIEAAAMEMYLPDQPGVFEAWWARDEGIALSGDRWVRFACLVTPQMAATVAGYAAAWDEEKWQAMGEDQQKVVGEIAGQLSDEFSGKDLSFVVGILDGGAPQPKAAVWFDGDWRGLMDPQGVSGIPLARFTSDAYPAQGALSARWAAQYLLGAIGDIPALGPADQISICVYQWPRVPTSWYSQRQFADLVPAPEVTERGFVRLALGDEEAFAFIDLDLR